MASEIVFYDIPSRDPPKCWSLNPWKARLSLNYKGLPYRTEWLEYPDIAGKLRGAGVPTNDKSDSVAEYSCPAVQLPDGSYVMESRKIARALDKLQPEPALHPDGERVDHVQKTVLKVQAALMPIAAVRIADGILPPRSSEYFHETRAKRFGMPLAEWAKSDKAGENAWKNAGTPMKELKAVLTENSEGPYVNGKEVGFADFIVAGFWEFLKRVSEGGDLFEGVMKFDPAFSKHYEACEKWLQRAD